MKLAKAFGIVLNKTQRNGVIRDGSCYCHQKVSTNSSLKYAELSIAILGKQPLCQLRCLRDCMEVYLLRQP